MAQRTVLHLTYNWISSGVSAFVSQTLPRMENEFLHNRLLVCNREVSVFDARLENAGIPVETLHAGVFSLGHYLKSLHLFRMFLEANPVDAVHLHCSSALELGFLAVARRAGIAMRVAHAHNSGIERGALHKFKTGINTLCRLCYQNAPTRVLACSTGAAEWICPPRFARDALIVPNGIEVRRYAFDPARRAAMRERYGLGQAFTLCLVGRLSDQKNPLFLLDVLAKVRTQVPDARLLLAGDGELRGELERHVRESGLGGSVIFAGTVSDVPAVLDAADVFVLPSVFEGFGIAAIEAQASGLRCIVSDAVPSDTAVTDGITYLPLADGAHVWADAIVPLAAGYKRENRSREITKAGYDIAATAKLLRDEYRRMLDPLPRSK